MKTSATGAAMRDVTARAFGVAATHMHRPGYAGPVCGQVSATGKGFARTHYTTDPSRVTCQKCRKALARSSNTANEEAPK